MNTIKIKITLLKSLISIILVTLLPSLSFAHHSSSEFTNTQVELEGTLIQVSWRNPHPSLTFQLSNTEELWNIQIPGTIESLTANGITASSFEVGQSINIAGLTSRRISYYLQGTNVLFPDGNELILKKGLQLLWTQPVEIVNETVIDSGITVPDVTTNFSINYKIFFVLSIFICLFSAYGLILLRNKNLQASL